LVVKHFISRKTLVAADTKPTPLSAQPVILEELDTGTFYKSDGSTISIFKGPTKPETLKNKNLDLNTTELYGFNQIQDYPFLENYEQKGLVMPATTVSNSMHGLIQDSTLHNPDSVKIDSSYGVGINFQSLIEGVKLGFTSTIPITRRDKGFEIKIEAKSNAKTVLVGFSTVNAYDPVNIFGATDKGVALGWTLASPWITAFNHDGSGPVQFTSSAIGKGIALHTLEIILTVSDIKCIIDDAQTLTLTTDIPSLTDNLYLLIYGIQ
jgi:hypothetical protein